MPDYDSPFFITNDRLYIDQAAVEDGTAVVWPLSDDAKLRRSPERQYCGNYATYGDKGAAVYRHNSDTHDLIAAGPNQHRDMVSSFPMVKTKARAQARADRQLLDVQEQDVRITTRLVDIPATRVTLAKAGMRLQIKGTHWWPACDTWHYARIVTAQPSPHTDGSLYDIDLELVLGDESSGPPAPDYEGGAFAELNRSYSPTGTTDLAYNYRDGGGAGSHTIPLDGPLQVDQSVAPFSSITALEPMIVGIGLNARFAGVFFDPQVVRIDLTVNGVTVAFGQTTASGGFWAELLACHVDDYHLDAGDVVSYTSSPPLDTWGASAPDETYLAVVRGVYGLDDLGNPLFYGPTFAGPYNP